MRECARTRCLSEVIHRMESRTTVRCKTCVHMGPRSVRAAHMPLDRNRLRLRLHRQTRRMVALNLFDRYAPFSEYMLIVSCWLIEQRHASMISSKIMLFYTGERWSLCGNVHFREGQSLRQHHILQHLRGPG